MTVVAVSETGWWDGSGWSAVLVSRVKKGHSEVVALKLT